MKTCSAIERDRNQLAAVPPQELPGWVRDHLTTCRTCQRRLAAARLAGGMIAARAGDMTPSEGFAERVTHALTRRPSPEVSNGDLWKPAWGLVPAFTAAVITLFVLYQTSSVPGPTGFFSTDSLSAGEQLVLGSDAPETDTVLAAVLEGNGR
jgi:hypothetical protein